MGYSIVIGDITKVNVDMIINASNGIGYMGGYLSRYVRFPGVAESINYASKGKVEKEVKKKCNIFKRYNAGDIFVTSGTSLNAKYIMHAVTMNYPGNKSDIKTIRKLIPKIIQKAYDLNVRTIAIPLLGTGVGRLDKDEILRVYNEYFVNIKNLNVFVMSYE